jgi:hypothetical protein
LHAVVSLPQDLNKTIGSELAIGARNIEMGYRVKSAWTKRRDQDTRLLAARVASGIARTSLHKLERRSETPLALIEMFDAHSRLSWRS